MLINFYFDETMLHLFTLNFIQLKRHDICILCMGIICRQGFIYLSVDAEAPKARGHQSYKAPSYDPAGLAQTGTDRQQSRL